MIDGAASLSANAAVNPAQYCPIPGTKYGSNVAMVRNVDLVALTSISSVSNISILFQVDPSVVNTSNTPKVCFP